MTNLLLTLSNIQIAWLASVLGIAAGLAIGATIYIVVGRKRGKLQPRVKTNAKDFSFKSITYLTKVSMFSALAVVLLYIEFPLLPAVPHLKLNVSDVPSLLASFMFGPITGAVVNAVKVGVCLLLRGTTTGFVGDLSNLVSGTLYTVIAGFIYLLRRNKVGAIISLAVSSAVFCVAMWFCNQWFLLPMFGIKDVAAMMPMLWWTLLFNVIKTVLTCLLTFFIYKPLSRALHWEIGGKKKAAVDAVQTVEAASTAAEQPAISNDSSEN